jgi:flavin-binding protein dodecin
MTQAGDEVIGGVVKVIELVGSSPRSFSDAVRNAVKVASQTIRNIKGVEVLSSNAEVDPDGNIVNYKVQCKIAFLVEAASAASFASTDVGATVGIESGAPYAPASTTGIRGGTT